jgi:hypothetical protein
VRLQLEECPDSIEKATRTTGILYLVEAEARFHAPGLIGREDEHNTHPARESVILEQCGSLNARLVA